MIEDLVYYWTNSLPPTFNVANGDLLSLSYYPFKIATSDFMSYADCIRSSITKLIYRVGPNSELNLKALEATLIHLQEWRRRTNNAVDKMRWSLNDIKRWNTKPCQAWEIVENDYKFLIDTIGIDDRQLKSIISVIASLLQISESRRSVQETVSLTRLSNLTLIFLPLTFVSGLFSMTGDVAPGSSHFWVYFAVAIPVAVITFNVTMYFWWFRSLPRAAPKGGVLSRMRESIPVRSIW
ncbi:MAG: hypothetical protein M1813_002294 [Trichoglossum hirsutum]|nr:MAG: hypothetical protein M1813_002294 [Trichoglossum hirsutum]